MKVARTLTASLVLAAATAAGLTGCLPPQIFQATLENPSPRVGDSTILRLQVMAGWFRTPQFFYRAERGRIVGMNGETAAQGGFVRAGNQVRYFAPFTSNYPSADGIRQNDVIEIIAQDVNQISRTNVTVNVIGSTVVFSELPQNGTNGRLMVATDGGGGQLSPPQPLRDLQGSELFGASPSISPNGERMAYVFYPGDGTSQVRMRDASGYTLSLTSNARGLAVDPTWSPDGQTIAYASNHETQDGTFEIYMMNVPDQTQGGGRTVVRVTNNNWDERHPAWNPNMRTAPQYTFALSARKNNLSAPGGRTQNWNVYLTDLQGNYTRELSALQGDGEFWATEPAWRPDGNAVAYTRFGPVQNFQSGASKFQRVFVQEIQQSQTLNPLNLGNTDPNARESSPIWAMDRSNDVIFLSSEGNASGAGRVFRTTYQPGGGNTFRPNLVGPFQALLLPIPVVAGTNRDITGRQPLDWR